MERHQGTKRIHGEIKMSFSVLRHYFLQKKLSRKLMTFKVSHLVHVSVCWRMHYGAWEVLLLTAAEEQVLAKMLYLPSRTWGRAWSVQGLFQQCVEGIFCKAQP